MIHTQKSNDIDTNLNNLELNITKSIYTNISMGLFENHKLLFSFLIAINI